MKIEVKMGPKRQIIKFFLLLSLIITAPCMIYAAPDIPSPAAQQHSYVKKIIYVLEDSRFLYQIGEMDLNGDNKKMLTREGSNWAPSVSSNGEKIAYFSDRSGFTNLWEMDADGTNQQQLTLNKENLDSIDLQNRGQIEWSKDSAVIYFLKENDIWQIDRNGETPSALTEYHDVTSFKLSPDKTKVLFSREKTKKHNGLWTMNLDETSPRQITQSIIAIPAFDWGDNISLAYFHNRGITTTEYIGVNRKFIKETYYLDNDIEWSRANPADKMQNYIAYISDKNQGPNIWIMKPDGSSEEQITTNGGFSPYWFPDGSSLVFVEGSDIYSINLRTKSKTRLTFNFSAYSPIVAEIAPAYQGSNDK
jgi:Tol biopolymer transport system component